LVTKYSVIILAIDPAASFGYAIFDTGSGHPVLVHSDCEVFKMNKKAPGRKWRLADVFIKALIGDLKPDLVIYEDVVRNVSTLSYHSYGYFKYMIQSACDGHGVEFEGIGVGTWKKAFTGSGNADKDRVQAVCKAMYPDVTWKTHDQSDAVGIGMGYLLK